MTTNNQALLAAALTAVLCHAAPALADDDTFYPNSLRIGSESVFYHTHADDISGPYVPSGVNLKADNLETVYLGYVRSVTRNIDFELALGYPPLAKVEGRGPATLGSVPYNGVQISSARWLSPTVFLEYKFGDESWKLRPYLGVGVNYTAFYARDTTAQGDAANGGPTKLSLTSSVGPAGVVGLNYHVSGHWNVYASYSVARVDTNLRADTAGEIRTTHISFGPQVLVLSGGYSF